MSRLIAIGDVHGMAGKLNGLLGQVEPDPTDTFVFLGDYIDIGHESYQVIESILESVADPPPTTHPQHDPFAART